MDTSWKLSASTALPLLSCSATGLTNKTEDSQNGKTILSHWPLLGVYFPRSLISRLHKKNKVEERVNDTCHNGSGWTLMVAVIKCWRFSSVINVEEIKIHLRHHFMPPSPQKTQNLTRIR